LRFITRKDSWSRGGTERTLHEAQLVDVSVVDVAPENWTA